MLVLIDESGDPGFKLARGSSPFFVVAMVLFRDFEEAERARLAIRDGRESLRVKPEFKFNKASDPVRDGFFELVLPFDFRVRALVVDKARIYSTNLREETERFYNYFVKLLMKHDHGALIDAHVKIDGSGNRPFQREMKRYLRQQLGPGKIRSFKFADSRRDSLIQLADMAAGAIARSYREGDRTRHNRWRRALEPKIEDVWEFR
uniref:DUF3800 domain-containing protein n=1 Tax=Candidatus Kentrum sp. FM TaxID=2126340 RepID=A0A450U091_9GAMM|nr:MAG: Protein of unknown function (DUF3800) [Candidatus Kentron sp. FM]VFJ75717.1 MAG: Protein of unknown function (DUF3800) [Candidatus Kentron sp. FM]VFK22644.1 MAG: Protein of unknown function (DUF3800) [Candidatus Kentron sp. FM]